jgi:hypothetical protein
MMAELHDIVIDAAYPASIARFWASALNGYEVAPYDDEEIARLRANGILDIEDDPSVLVHHPDGSRPRLFFQLVPEPKTAKNRLHLDLRATDPAAELDRLCAAGASIVTDFGDHVLLVDPEGNEFCLSRR